MSRSNQKPTIQKLGEVGGRATVMNVDRQRAQSIPCWVVKLSLDGKINWGEIGSGLIPDLRLFLRPTDRIIPHIQKVAEQFQRVDRLEEINRVKAV